MNGKYDRKNIHYEKIPNLTPENENNLFGQFDQDQIFTHNLCFFVGFFLISVITIIGTISYNTSIKLNHTVTNIDFSELPPFLDNNKSILNESEIIVNIKLNHNVTNIDFSELPPFLDNNKNILNESEIIVDNHCGVVWFYHIGKCGGSTMGKWLKMHKEEGDIDIYDRIWSNDDSIDLHWESQHLPKIEKEMKNIRKLGWVAKKMHHRTPGMVWLIQNLTRWRKIVEKQGCKFILMTIVRDPIERIISLHFYNNITLDKIASRVSHFSNGMNKYLLYNMYNNSKTFEEALPMGRVYIQWWELSKDIVENTIKMFENFDIIGDTANLNLLFEKIENLTNWPRRKLETKIVNKTPKKNKYPLPPEVIIQMGRVTKNDSIVYDYLLRNNKILI